MKSIREIILVLVITCFFLQDAAAQSKTQRRIYLWDVTLSMKGYKGLTPDIYEDVVRFLKREITSLTDEFTEIIVLPFQEDVLEHWVVNATELGKKEIVNSDQSSHTDNITSSCINNKGSHRSNKENVQLPYKYKTINTKNFLTRR